MPLESLIAGVPYDWRSFGEYLDRIDGTTAVNAGFLVGHSALRRCVMGDDAVGKRRDARTRSRPCARCSTRRSPAAASDSRRRGRAPTTTPTATPCRHAPRPRTSSSRSARRRDTTRARPSSSSRASVGSRRSTSSSWREMSKAANRPLNWNVLVPNAAPRGVRLGGARCGRLRRRTRRTACSRSPSPTR